MNSTSNIVKLNIGGVKYITTRQTLFGHSGTDHSFFRGLLNGDVPSLILDKDWYGPTLLLAICLTFQVFH